MIAVKSNDISFFIKSAVLAICLMLTLFTLSSVLFGDQSVVALQKAKDSLASIKSQLTQIDIQNATISNEIRLLQSDQAYLEKMIRQQLNYVKGSEIIYVFEKEEENPYWNGADIYE